MPSDLADARFTVVALRLTLSGRVQGFGVRPAIARLAADLNLTGTVMNCLNGVEVWVEGTSDRVQRFEERLPKELPVEARLDVIQREPAPSLGCSTFEIRELADLVSERLDATGVSAEVPRDCAVCEECLRDSATAGNRRFLYPFTSCTRCGPRYSLLEGMPYERSRSSMRQFPLCRHCRGEYTDGSDRRFHAQTLCCPECGPQVWCVRADGRMQGQRELALPIAIAAIQQGQIVALRGVGGYQLLCDATNAAAVRRLRERKRRTSKPLAVMVESLSAAESLALINDEERRELTSAANPIVLSKARSESSVVAEVHPGLNEVGVMLPTTALHWYLASELRKPIVVTSGNIEEEPLVSESADAERELAGIADLWLHHDRPILRRIDDSVVRVIAGRTVTIRAARGIAPLPLTIPAAIPLLALGGQQKGAVAISNGRQCVLGPHVGDLDNLATQARFSSEVGDLLHLFGQTPQVVVHDFHPDYFTSRWAQSQSLPLVGVQHHHAHIAAGMVEHHWLDREVIGIAFDGTGYGPDGTIWGGEFLLATAASYRRVGRLRPFSLPGSEAAIREPWRVAVALVSAAAGQGVASELSWQCGDDDAVQTILKIQDNPQFSPRTSSVGRLFDGVAALILGVDRVDYEGQAAMLLEAACDVSAAGEYVWAHLDGEVEELDWRPMIGRLLQDRAAGVSPGVVAMRFHRGLATAAARVACRYAPRPIVLGGGTFQNRILTELLVEHLKVSGQALGLPGQIPPNDGGLAAGQLAIASARFKLDRSC